MGWLWKDNSSSQKDIPIKIKEKEPSSLEDYKKAGIVSVSSRLRTGATNKDWQKEWEIRKKFLKPYEKPPNRFGGKHSNALYNKDDFDTGYQTYCAFINDCLKELRKGNTVYCFYIYQIEDLYRFIPDINVIYLEDVGSFAVYSKGGYEEWVM